MENDILLPDIPAMDAGPSGAMPSGAMPGGAMGYEDMDDMYGYGPADNVEIVGGKNALDDKRIHRYIFLFCVTVLLVNATLGYQVFGEAVGIETDLIRAGLLVGAMAFADLVFF